MFTKISGSHIVQGIYYLFTLIMVVTVCILLFFSRNIEYSEKTYTNNILWAITSIIILVSICFLYKIIPPKIKSTYAERSNKLINILPVLFFFIQLYLIYNYYFMTGWDPRALFIAIKENPLWKHDYFSRYPNNLFLLFIFTIVRSFDSLWGVFDTSIGLMGLIVFQCVICLLTGRLFFDILEEITGRKSIAWGGWGIYLILVGFSPWISIPYSDATGLLFPTLIFYLYLKYKKTNCIWIMGIISLFSFWGYKIKPQILIIFIAVIISESILFAINRKECTITYLKQTVAVIAGAMIALGSSKAAIQSLNIPLDPEMAFGAEHFIMMGLDDESNGVYNEEDVNYSISFSTKIDRQKANISVIKKRIHDFGIIGLTKHLIKKNLTNFSDGTFAWGREGSFFSEIFEDKNLYISPILKSIYYTDGARYYIYKNIAQAAWIFVLVGTLGISFNYRDNCNLIALLLSLIGIVLFELIFEARARYLFTYVPIFIMVSMIGWNNIIKTFYSKCVLKRKTQSGSELPGK